MFLLLVVCVFCISDQRLGEKVMQNIEMNLNNQTAGTQLQYRTKLQTLRVWRSPMTSPLAWSYSPQNEQGSHDKATSLPFGLVYLLLS